MTPTLPGWKRHRGKYWTRHRAVVGRLKNFGWIRAVQRDDGTINWGVSLTKRAAMTAAEVEMGLRTQGEFVPALEELAKLWSRACDRQDRRDEP